MPPGPLKIKLTEDHPESGDYLHTGGFVVVHKDNTVEINLTDCVDRSEIRGDNFEKGEYENEDT